MFSPILFKQNWSEITKSSLIYKYRKSIAEKNAQISIKCTLKYWNTADGDSSVTKLSVFWKAAQWCGKQTLRGVWSPDGVQEKRHGAPVSAERQRPTRNHSHCSSTAALPPASTLPQVPLLATCFAQKVEGFTKPPLASQNVLSPSPGTWFFLRFLSPASLLCFPSFGPSRWLITPPLMFFTRT